MTEFDWIARHFRPLTRQRDGTFSLTNDGATLDVAEGKQLVITTDTLCENVHFLQGTPADLIARKALCVNLSDLAAMGASPLAYNLALSLPPTTEEAWMRSFCRGLKAEQNAFDLYLLGGDTTSSPAHLVITITAFGLVEKDRALTRSGAKIGDVLYVSGAIGNVGLGLQMLQGRLPHEEDCIRAHQLPTPRLDISSTIQNTATSCMDISDGLLQDASHIAKQSLVALSLDAEAIPISLTAKKYLQEGRIEFLSLLTSGDDYELLFTLPPDVTPPLGCTAIGKAVRGSGISLLDGDGRMMSLPEKLGYQHF